MFFKLIPNHDKSFSAYTIQNAAYFHSEAVVNQNQVHMIAIRLIQHKKIKYFNSPIRCTALGSHDQTSAVAKRETQEKLHKIVRLLFHIYLRKGQDTVMIIFCLIICFINNIATNMELTI